MNAAELQTITRKHFAVLDGIEDLMAKHKVTEIEGEMILLFLAGLSAGQRQAPINKVEWVKPIALAWRFGAEHGD